MSARRPRLGVLLPSTDTTLEDEVPHLLGGRATAHFQRVRLPSVTTEGLQVLVSDSLASAAVLADLEPDLLLFGCTSGSFVRGHAGERQLAHDLASAARAPVITTGWAVVQAIRHRGQRVRLRTPYDDELTAMEGDYLEAAGLSVTDARGLGLTRDRDIALTSPTALLELADGDDDAEVLFVSCTNLPTLAVLWQLTRHTGLPVVTSNLAAAECALWSLDGRLAPPGQPPGTGGTND